MAALANERHEKFALQYVKTGNAKRAYMKVYPDSSERAAETSASDLLRKPEVKKRVKELNDRSNAEVMNAIGLTKERLLQMALETYSNAQSLDQTETQRKTLEMMARDQGMFLPQSSTKVESKEETTIFTVSMGKDLGDDD